MDLIDFRDRRPIYEQIVDRYKTLILKRALAPDERMPSVRKLAMELSTNPNTVQKAYTELERQGCIYTVPGRGNFVCGGEGLLEMKKDELKKEIIRILKEAEDIGIDPKQMIEEAMDTMEGGKRT